MTRYCLFKRDDRKPAHGSASASSWNAACARPVIGRAELEVAAGRDRPAVEHRDDLLPVGEWLRPPGAQQAIIVGNPKNAEAYVIRVKLAKGTKVAPHTHPNDENVTVISGTFNIGVGEKLDETKGQTVKAGGFFSVPKGKAHFAWASEDTVIQLHGVGPAGATFVNPADAPK